MYYISFNGILTRLSALLRVSSLNRHLSRAPTPRVSSLVYDPKSGTNEEDSEVLFRSFSEAAGLNPSDSKKVSEYIIATKQHDASASEDRDLRAFIDLDMAVVGRERGAYLAYASQVSD